MLHKKANKMNHTERLKQIKDLSDALKELNNEFKIWLKRVLEAQKKNRMDSLKRG